jgi:predicted nucleic acid-binding protein
METISTHLLDANALVRLVAEEIDNQALREYFTHHRVFWTTSFCFAKALGLLKAMHNRQLISRGGYQSACDELLTHLRNRSIRIEEVEIAKKSVFEEVEAVAEAHSLDLIDALQIVTLKRGFSSKTRREGKTMLITDDTDVADTVRSSGWCVWDCGKEEAPEWVSASFDNDPSL